jgi:hypothetical protein
MHKNEKGGRRRRRRRKKEEERKGRYSTAQHTHSRTQTTKQSESRGGEGAKNGNNKRVNVIKAE